MLRADHKKVSDLFAQYEGARSVTKKKSLVDQICNVCWSEWLKLQQQLINHYGLNLREQRSKEFLFGELEKCLFTTSPQS